MKTIKQIESEIAQLQVDVQALKNKPVKKNPDTGIALHPLENGQIYYFHDGEINNYQWTGDTEDKRMLAAGQIHLDRKSAEQKLAAMKTEQLMRVASHDAWIEYGEEIDWDSEAQSKWCFTLGSFKHVNINFFCHINKKHPFPTLQSIEAFREQVGDGAIINMIKWLGV